MKSNVNVLNCSFLLKSSCRSAAGTSRNDGKGSMYASCTDALLKLANAPPDPAPACPHPTPIHSGVVRRRVGVSWVSGEGCSRTRARPARGSSLQIGSRVLTTWLWHSKHWPL